MIDEYPILAGRRRFAEGETRMLGLGELRVGKTIAWLPWRAGSPCGVDVEEGRIGSWFAAGRPVARVAPRSRSISTPPPGHVIWCWAWPPGNPSPSMTAAARSTPASRLCRPDESGWERDPSGRPMTPRLVIIWTVQRRPARHAGAVLAGHSNLPISTAGISIAGSGWPFYGKALIRQ